MLFLLDWDVMWHNTCRCCLTVSWVVAGGYAITTFTLCGFWMHCFLRCRHTSRLPRFIWERAWEGSGRSLGVIGPLVGSFHSWSLCVRLLCCRCAGLSLPQKSAGEWGPPQCSITCVLFIIAGCAFKNRIETKQNWSERRLTEHF